jgi:hypothetical protein
LSSIGVISIIVEKRVTFELELSSIVAVENSSIRAETNAQLMIET